MFLSWYISLNKRIWTKQLLPKLCESFYEQSQTYLCFYKNRVDWLWYSQNFKQTSRRFLAQLIYVPMLTTPLSKSILQTPDWIHRRYTCTGWSFVHRTCSRLTVVHQRNHDQMSHPQTGRSTREAVLTTSNVADVWLTPRAVCFYMDLH